MKPEIRIQLLKEYEKAKKNNDPKLGFAIFGFLILFLLSFILLIADGDWKKFVLLFPIFCALVFLAKYYFDKRLILILSALLDKTEEPIQKEKVELDGIDWNKNSVYLG